MKGKIRKRETANENFIRKYVISKELKREGYEKIRLMSLSSTKQKCVKT